MTSSAALKALRAALDDFQDDLESRTEQADIVFGIQTLLQHQFVLEQDRQVRAYQAVANHWDVISAVLSLCGFRPTHVQSAGIYGIQVAAIFDENGDASRPPLGRPISLMETCLLLVLRDLYDVKMREGRSERDMPGTVLVSTDEIRTAMQDMGPRRSYTSLSAMVADLRKLQHHRILVVRDKQPGDDFLVVRLQPTLPLVTPEKYIDALMRFIDHAAAIEQNPNAQSEQPA